MVTLNEGYFKMIPFYDDYELEMVVIDCLYFILHVET